MSARYSHLKAFKFPDRIAAIRAGAIAGPVHVQLILSDLCNQDCGFCAFRDSARGIFERPLFGQGAHNPNRQIAFDKVIEILDDCAEMGVRAIELTGGGEPTIHPQFAQVVDAINARGIQWGIVTNGVREQDLSSATWIRVSLDAVSRETYSKIRRVKGQHFDAALATIARWNPGVGFVVTRDNWREIFEAALLVRERGAQNFRIRAHFDDAEGAALIPYELAVARGQAKRAVEELSTPEFEVHNQLDSDVEAIAGEQDYRRCGYQYFTTWIGADLNLYRCCLYAYTPRGLIASIKDRRFREAWCETAVGDFAAFDASGCKGCRYGPINRAINSVVDPDPSEAFV